MNESFGKKDEINGRKLIESNKDEKEWSLEQKEKKKGKKEKKGKKGKFVEMEFSVDKFDNIILNTQNCNNTKRGNTKRIDLKLKGTKPFIPKQLKNEINSGFNNYVSQAIENHKNKSLSLFVIDGKNIVVGKNKYVFDMSTDEQAKTNEEAGTDILKSLFANYTKKENIQIEPNDNFELSLSKENCILTNENKNGLYDLFKNEIIKNEEENQKRIKETMTKHVEELIKDKCLKFEGKNVIVNNKNIDIDSPDVNYYAVSEKIINDLIGKYKNAENENLIDLESIKRTANEVVILAEVKVTEKINSEIEDRRKILQDFNSYVSNAIEKHDNNKEGKLYKYENQKLCLCVDNSHYDTKENLINALINHLAITFANSKNQEGHNPFSSDQFKLGHIGVLDDKTKKKLGNSIDSAILNNLSKELNDLDYVKFYSFLCKEFKKQVAEREFMSIEQIKTFILRQFIKEKYKANEIFDQITDNQLANVAISSEKLTCILSYSIFDKKTTTKKTTTKKTTTKKTTTKKTTTSTELIIVPILLILVILIANWKN